MLQFHDVLIVGSGGSGLSLAIKLKEAGIKNIAIITKTQVMGSHTAAAKGGINAALSSVIKDDYKWHAFDTLKSATDIADEERVNYMCKTAPEEIAFLENHGVNFDKLENGKIAQRRYGGQKTHYGKGDFAYRACFSSDSTGYEIMKGLYNSAKNLDIKIYEFYFAFDVKREEEKATSLFALNLQSGKLECFKFNFLVFAGGGFSQNFQTNSSSNALTGDCHGLALKLGCKMHDMEFIQFHPTGLYGSGILISEAARGEGGYLLNSKGERFMKKYSPNFMELAQRDVITKAIFEEGGGKKPAFLSIKHLPENVIKEKLAGTVLTAKFFAKIDVFKEDIPVFPTAHYNMGGIEVDFNYKVPNLLNVFAIGECAGSKIHGANRLGCNSLLELFTSSTLVKDAIKNNLMKVKRHPELNNMEDIKIDILGKKNKFSFDKILSIKSDLASLMQEKCGVLRSKHSLEECYEKILIIKDILQNSSPQIKTLVFSNEFVAFYETINLVELSLITVLSAINRRETRGSHIRVDY